MKIITKFLITWCICVASLTLLFRYTLAGAVMDSNGTLAILISIGFGLSLFVLGWVLGKRHSLNIFTYGGGFHFHLSDYLIFGLVSELWLQAGLGAPNELRIHHYILLFWGVGVLVHAISYFAKLKNGTIKGVASENIFD